AEAAQGRVQGHAGAGDAAAEDEQVKGPVRERWHVPFHVRRTDPRKPRNPKPAASQEVIWISRKKFSSLLRPRLSGKSPTPITEIDTGYHGIKSTRSSYAVGSPAWAARAR